MKRNMLTTIKHTGGESQQYPQNLQIIPPKAERAALS